LAITRSADAPWPMPSGSVKLAHEAAAGAIDLFVIREVRT
jgi:hypothetical protein